MKPSESNVKRILLVEDEPAICSLCQRILTHEGFEVDIATNGEVAQGTIGQQNYALFLFDIKLPVMTGMELYQWLQEKHPQLAGRVIFTSGRLFLPKPFTAAELITIVREALKQLGK